MVPLVHLTIAFLAESGAERRKVAIEAMARQEAVAPTLCFNGDFNRFKVADPAFAEVNRRVLGHDAILGNVEAEFLAAPWPSGFAGLDLPFRPHPPGPGLRPRAGAATAAADQAAQA